MITSARSLTDGLTRIITQKGDKFEVTRIGGVTSSSFITDQNGLNKLFIYPWLWEVTYSDKGEVMMPEKAKKRSGFEGELEVKDKSKIPKPKVAQVSLL